MKSADSRREIRKAIHEISSEEIPASLVAAVGPGIHLRVQGRIKKLAICLGARLQFGFSTNPRLQYYGLERNLPILGCQVSENILYYFVHSFGLEELVPT